MTIHIVIYSANSIDHLMAGPAIRSWQFAQTLSQNARVTLLCPNRPENIDKEKFPFNIVCKKDIDLNQLFKEADVLITQCLTISFAWMAKKHHVKIIIDAYDPVPLEALEQFKHEPAKSRDEKVFSSINQLIFYFKMADSIICASEKQRDLWIGFLLSLKLISPDVYNADNSLRKLIDVVPFGLCENEPVKTGPGIREKYHLNSLDTILLWGGGIWNWFDPLSLIQAMKELQEIKPDIKLVFLGLKNPDPSVPEMKMGAQAIKLATDLELINQTVFFNTGWIPYDERHNYFLDADIGVSTHFDHLETRYSFRTRMLDYIWADLPILATEGDSFAELIQQNDVGFVVPYNNASAIAKAILDMVDNKHKLKFMKENLITLKPLFYWSKVIKPIHHMIDHFKKDSSTSLKFRDISTISFFIYQQIKEKGLKQCFNILIKKINRS